MILWLLAALPARAEQPVLRLQLDGPILPITASYLERGLEKAEQERAILLLELDTPGGLVDTTLNINQRILNSPVPVIVYVHPAGGRAASAGVYLLYASHLAAMTPETRLGAATPISLGGGGENKDDAMTQKIRQDLRAHLRGLARKRERNLEWAERSVEQGVSLTARESLAENVIEILAEDSEALLHQVRGTTLVVAGEEWLLEPGEITDLPMHPGEQFLKTVSNPQVALILMMVGFYGIIYGLNNPGTLLPESVGAICLITGLFALGGLPINYAGLGLVLLSVVLFAAELMTPTYGALSLAGIVALMVGGSMLIPQGYPFLEISTSFLLGLGLAMALLFGLLLHFAVGSLRRRPVTGDEVLVGQTGRSYTPLEPGGQVRVCGETWRAVTSDGSFLAAGRRVRVKERRGLTLRVEPILPGEDD